MSKNKEDRHIAGLDVWEFDTKDGGTDHRIEVMFGYGGLKIEYDTTIDKVRRFFVEHRNRREKAQLALVEKVGEVGRKKK